MKKIRIKIGDLFKVLDLDNKKYEQIQKTEHVIKIKTDTNELVAINGFVKKDKLPMVKVTTSSNKTVVCSEKHIFRDNNKQIFAKNASCIDTIYGNENVKIKKIKEKQYAYDISIPYPHFYQDAQGIIHHNTTCAKIIARTISEDVLYINASSQSGVDVVRSEIEPFCATNGFGDSKKIIILDEMEMSSDNFQTALREVIEKFYTTTRFILICNFVNKVIEPLRSRTQDYKFGDINQIDIMKRCMGILNAEGVTYTKANVAKIVKNLNTDMRRIINTMQKLTSVVDGKKVLSPLSSLDVQKLELLEMIKAKELSKFRKFMGENNISADEITKFLFNKAFEKKLSEDNWVEIIAELSEVAYRLKLGVDPEITVINGVLQIMQLI